jgi:multidrug transporter EmrE-like cation transporter
MRELFLSWGMLVISVVFNALGVFIIKMRINVLGPIKIESLREIMSYFLMLCKSPIVLSGLLMFSLAPFLFAIALSRMEITIAYPVQIGLNFVILFVLAVLFLGETLTIHKMIGTVLVLISIYFLSK